MSCYVNMRIARVMFCSRVHLMHCSAFVFDTSWPRATACLHDITDYKTTIMSCTIYAIHSFMTDFGYLKANG